MPSSFAITTAVSSTPLDAGRSAQVSFTVSNTSGHPMRGRARVTGLNPVAAAWLTLTGQAEREFAASGTQQYAVRVAVPQDAPAGDYTFRLDMVGVNNPDEDLTQGPTVTFQVPQPIEKKKPFPWWIVAVAAAVVIVAGIVLFLVLSPKSVQVPVVVGRPQPAAQQTLEAVGLNVGPIVTIAPDNASEGIVLTQQPGAGTQVPRGAAVALWVAGPQPTPTNTPLPTSTPTPIPTPTPLFSGAITVRNDGAYVARVYVSYFEQGQRLRQGGDTFRVGMTRSIEIPSDASNIEVTFDVQTFIASWSTVDTRFYPGPVIKCFIMTGTSLNARVDETGC
jgi:hypothetical protein